MNINILLHLLANFSVKQKLYGGFAIILMILAIIVAVSLGSINETLTKVKTVTTEIQPTLIASSALETAVQQGTASLGMFLLSNDNDHKVEYKNNLIEIKEALSVLKNTVELTQDAETQELMVLIESSVNQFMGFEKKIIQLGEDRLLNFPAMEYARGNLNPLNVEISQILTAMIESEADEESSDARKELIITLSGLKGMWANITVNVRVFLYLNNPDAKANIRLFLGGLETTIEKIQKMGVELNFEQEEGIESLGSLIKQWVVSFENIIGILDSDKARMDAYVIKNEIGPLLKSISFTLGSLVENQTRLTQQTSTELQQQATASSRLITILLVIGLVIGALLAWLITQIIVRPLILAASALDNIADGEGDLSLRLNQMGKDEISHLANGFNRFASKIQLLIQEVANSVQHLSDSSNKMAQSTIQSATMIEKQCEETTEIAAAITEFSATAQMVAKNAEMAVDAAVKVDKETVKSRDIFEDVLSSIGRLGENIDASTDTIQDLGNEITAIGTVIDIIRGITDQTNLLALNAAIEAARAGEQGRGFAVVADEVRALAVKTKQSTSEIQQKIETLQTQAYTAVKSMSANRDEAANVIEKATLAGNSLKTISTSVTEITDMTKEISSTAEQQYLMVEKVNVRVDNVSNLATQVASGAKVVSQSSDGLEELSVTLKTLVRRFKY